MLMAGRIAMTAATRKRFGNGSRSLWFMAFQFWTIAISRENLRDLLEWGECFRK